MFKKIEPITAEAHSKKRVSPITNFDFASGTNLASIMVHEFARAASIYPIVFLEDTDNEEFRPAVLLGLEQEENLFVQDGKWHASYIPAIIRRYPFALAKGEEKDSFTICMDVDSACINETEGDLLFNDEGGASEVIERVKTFLSELQQMEVFTNEFCRHFASKNMFTPLNMQVQVNGEVKNIAGCYVLNEERLNNMSDESFLDLKEKRFLAPVFAHLISLAQVERLLRFKDATVGITDAGSISQLKEDKESTDSSVMSGSSSIH